MLQHNIPAWFLASKHFHAYVSYISNGVHAAPSHYQFLRMVDDLSLRAIQIIGKQLSNELFISFGEGAWSQVGKHYSAVTTGSHGTSIFVGAFDIEGGGGTAVNSANAINQLMLASLGLDPSLGASHECVPLGKISNMTSDTTNFLPTAAMELKDNYRLFKAM
jgi:hypothetical protein